MLNIQQYCEQHRLRQSISQRYIGLFEVGKRVDRTKWTIVDGPFTNLADEKLCFIVQCDCGTIAHVSAYRLGKRSKSCPCQYRTSGGYSDHPLYSIYYGMLARCRKGQTYVRRGISICDEWQKGPVVFVEWGLANGWQPGLTLDRKDGHLGYSPDNCQFLDKLENAKKQITNKFITIGDETHNITDWCKIKGISRELVSMRVHKLGWDIVDAIVKPKRTTKSKTSNRAKFYNVWYSMINRCTNPNDTVYEYYGGRGIGVCQKWLDRDNFNKWALPRWRPGLVLDRRDSKLDYCPSNCRFVTKKRSARNNRKSWLVTISGRTQCLMAWCEERDLCYSTIVNRIKNIGLTPQQALSKPTPRRYDGSSRTNSRSAA